MTVPHTKRIAVDAVFAAVALILFLVEAQVPLPIPIPGIKLGLANIITLIAMQLFGKRDAAMILIVRIMLGAILAGTVASFLFSASGGILCFLLLCLLQRFTKIPLWARSVLGAAAHNIGQLLTAWIWMKTASVFWYFPYLLLAAIVSGCFTGLCAQFLLPRLKKGVLK